MRTLTLAAFGLLVVSTALPAGAVQIEWAFEGSVDEVGSDSDPSGPSVGTRFSSVIRFTSDPLSATQDGTTSGHFVWQDVTVGVELTVGGQDFSVIGAGEFFELTKYDGQFSSLFPGHSGPVDALLFGTHEDQFCRPPPLGTCSFRRNLALDLVDFDALVFDELGLPLEPPSLSAFEHKRLGALFDDPDQTVRFSGEIDRIEVVPEPGTFLLLASGLLGFAASRRPPHRRR